MALPTTIRTERLLLRPWTDADREPFAAMNADPAVMEFLPAVTRAESDAAVERVRRHIAERGFGFWAAELPEGGPSSPCPFIGFIGLAASGFEAHFTPCVEIGWRLAHAHWGKGYATEGARAALAFGFDELGLDSLVSLTVARNVRSRHVMEKLGMQRDLDGDFDHPRVAPESPLRRHVLYRLMRDAWSRDTRHAR